MCLHSHWSLLHGETRLTDLELDLVTAGRLSALCTCAHQCVHACKRNYACTQTCPCMCMLVSLCVYIYIYIYVDVQTRTHIHKHRAVVSVLYIQTYSTYIHAFVHPQMHLFMHACLQTYIHACHICACVDRPIHVWLGTCISACIQACMPACMLA